MKPFHESTGNTRPPAVGCHQRYGKAPGNLSVVSGAGYILIKRRASYALQEGLLRLTESKRPTDRPTDGPVQKRKRMQSAFSTAKAEENERPNRNAIDAGDKSWEESCLTEHFVKGAPVWLRNAAYCLAAKAILAPFDRRQIVAEWQTKPGRKGSSRGHNIAIFRATAFGAHRHRPIGKSRNELYMTLSRAISIPADGKIRHVP
ncbi:sugar ABC transporter ATPase [Anopheles sinensis]|uniref:Sugar ABC transporter ATPase n=1 Tax=Anopheles sinensis TaxID=74873 RepID=A0A084WC17_ANOSI|nr:sugar ABC transporter ATPase [Anopheles sinensis]